VKTLRIDDELHRRAKAEAVKQGMSLTHLVEKALRELLDPPPPSPGPRRRLPVSSATGGLAPGFSSLEEAVAAADFAVDLRQARGPAR
jgi:hypothetical protein